MAKKVADKSASSVKGKAKPGGEAGAAAQGAAAPAQAPFTSLSALDRNRPPATPADAPLKIQVPAPLAQHFEQVWQESLRTGREHSAPVGRDTTGGLSMGKVTPGAETEIPNPDRTVGAGQEVQGIFHTHPNAFTQEGGYPGPVSADDGRYLVGNGDAVVIAQSGDQQFMFVRTAETPSKVDPGEQRAQENRLIDLTVDEGKTGEEAARQVAREFAEKHKLAYYEGSGGNFQRVSP